MTNNSKSNTRSKEPKSGLKVEKKQSPYFSSKGLKRALKKGKWTYKKGFRAPSKGTRKPLKELMFLHCRLCCADDTKEVRNCSCFECPFWRYRSNKNNLHRAMLGGLKANEPLSEKELDALQELRESVQQAEERVIGLSEKYCKQKTGWFRKAYSGKSRASAIKAIELYLAYYDTSQVVPFDEWLEDEIRIWMGNFNKKGLKS